MPILNIAGYKFVPLANIADLRLELLDFCKSLFLKGTILLSEEGININLAGTSENITLFKNHLNRYPELQHLTFRESYSTFQPFDRIKVRIKKEIITLRRPEVRPDCEQAPAISPQKLKQWLDEKRDILLLDTRNDYEIRFGSFQNAVTLPIKDFKKFPDAIENIPNKKTIVMFCTGGIRCEKAALHMLQKGYSDVFQLQGGILNYFAQVGGTHYDGECYVFDNRISLDHQLQTTGTKQCLGCQGPIPAGSETKCLYC